MHPKKSRWSRRVDARRGAFAEREETDGAIRCRRRRGNLSIRLTTAARHLSAVAATTWL